VKTSAGLVLWRRTDAGDLRVLLVHPSGPYNRKAPWGIPKGELDPGETAEDCAVRETEEETGVRARGPFVALGSVDYTKSRKRIFAFAAELPPDVSPRCASWEIDGAEMLALDEARRRIHPDQAPLLDRLRQELG
jgi:predicted NUDIX family NTP pyrophosphohydrolase